jgi:hypothetical protein
MLIIAEASVNREINFFFFVKISPAWICNYREILLLIMKTAASASAFRFDYHGNIAHGAFSQYVKGAVQG